MKTSIRSIRKLVREAVQQVLKESKCPHCGDPEAYEGLFSVECPNSDCQAYSEKQANDVGRSDESNDDETSDTLEGKFIIPAGYGIVDMYDDDEVLQDTCDSYDFDEMIYNDDDGLIIDPGDNGDIDVFLDGFTAESSEAKWDLYKMNPEFISEDVLEDLAERLDTTIEELEKELDNT